MHKNCESLLEDSEFSGLGLDYVSFLSKDYHRQ